VTLTVRKCLQESSNEKKYPNDKRPREAIEAAKNYIKALKTKDAQKIKDAAYAAYAAATRKELVQKIQDWFLERTKTLKVIK